MDRISALRNVEDALAEYEAGETDLASVEERVLTVVRTYATEFEERDRDAYRAVGGRADGLVVVAPDPGAARERVETLTDAGTEFDIERL